MPGRYLLRRTGLILYTLLVVSVLVFGITQVLPTDAATMLLVENVTPEQLAAIRERLGLNDPVPIQYLRWLGGVATGDFGTSMRSGPPVLPQILEALSRSLLLAALSIGLLLLLALPLGILAAVRRARAVDLGVSLASYVGISLPELVTATLAILVFADLLGWFPATGYVPLTEDPARSLLHLVLPVATVSLILVAHVSHMVRSELVGALHTDYVRAARLKGLPERLVLRRHALLPTITVVALDVGYVLGGIIVVEEIFAIPGIGRTLIVAVQNRDLPMVQAGALVMAATYCLMNFAADHAYAALDKRIQYG